MSKIERHHLDERKRLYIHYNFKAKLPNATCLQYVYWKWDMTAAHQSAEMAADSASNSYKRSPTCKLRKVPFNISAAVRLSLAISFTWKVPLGGPTASAS